MSSLNKEAPSWSLWAPGCRDPSAPAPGSLPGGPTAMQIPHHGLMGCGWLDPVPIRNRNSGSDFSSTETPDTSSVTELRGGGVGLGRPSSTQTEVTCSPRPDSERPFSGAAEQAHLQQRPHIEEDPPTSFGISFMLSSALTQGAIHRTHVILFIVDGSSFQK